MGLIKIVSKDGVQYINPGYITHIYLAKETGFYLLRIDMTNDIIDYRVSDTKEADSLVKKITEAMSDCYKFGGVYEVYVN
jgi:hypothetical protein